MEILITKNKLIKDNAGGKEQINSNHKNWQKYLTEYSKLLNKKVEVGDLQTIKEADIDLSKDCDINLQSAIKLLRRNDLSNKRNIVSKNEEVSNEKNKCLISELLLR